MNYSTQKGIFGPTVSQLLLDKGVSGKSGWYWNADMSTKFPINYIPKKADWMTAETIPAISLYTVIEQAKKVWFCPELHCHEGHYPIPAGEDGSDVDWTSCPNCVIDGERLKKYDYQYQINALTSLISSGAKWKEVEDWLIQSIKGQD